MNPSELLLAVGPLRAGNSGFAVLVAAYGVGMVVGALVNARAGSLVVELRRRWMAGIAVAGVGMLVSGVAPALWVGLASFLVTGIGNTMTIGSELRLFQELAPGAVMGRVLGLYDTLSNGAIASGLVCAGAILSWLGPRGVFLLAGIGTLATLTAAGAYLHTVTSGRSGVTSAG